MSTWCDPVGDHAPQQYPHQPGTTPGPDAKPTEQQPLTYVTEISVPCFGGDGIQRLHSRMLPPDPESQPEAGQ